MSDMLNPIDFPQKNKELKAPPGMSNCIPLPVFCDGQVIISCWEFDDAQLQDIVENRRIFLSIYAPHAEEEIHTHWPVALNTVDPFHDVVTVERMKFLMAKCSLTIEEAEQIALLERKRRRDNRPKLVIRQENEPLTTGEMLSIVAKSHTNN
ncbi:MAG: hypothetical protein INR73_28760 [Williamsia sp.]|nr:hypothetical protein [Williamsia sp.]